MLIDSNITFGFVVENELCSISWWEEWDNNCLSFQFMDKSVEDVQSLSGETIEIDCSRIIGDNVDHSIVFKVTSHWYKSSLSTILIELHLPHASIWLVLRIYKVDSAIVKICSKVVHMVDFLISENFKYFLLYEEVLNPCFLNDIEKWDDVTMSQEKWSIDQTIWWIELEVVSDGSIVKFWPIDGRALEFLSNFHWYSSIPFGINYELLISILALFDQVYILEVDLNVGIDFFWSTNSCGVPIEVYMARLSQSNTKLELWFMDNLSVLNDGVHLHISMDDFGIL